jgi:hypothetical protein
MPKYPPSANKRWENCLTAIGKNVVIAIHFLRSAAFLSTFIKNQRFIYIKNLENCQTASGVAKIAKKEQRFTIVSSLKGLRPNKKI